MLKLKQRNSYVHLPLPTMQTWHRCLVATLPWFPPNPRATGREGEGPIHLEDTPLTLLVPFCYFPSRIRRWNGGILGQSSHGRGKRRRRRQRTIKGRGRCRSGKWWRGGGGSGLLSLDPSPKKAFLSLLFFPFLYFSPQCYTNNQYFHVLCS